MSTNLLNKDYHSSVQIPVVSQSHYTDTYLLQQITPTKY